MRAYTLSIFQFSQSLLNQPVKVIWLCLAFAFINLVVDGTMLQLWSLNRNIQHLETETSHTEQKLLEVRAAIDKASDPDFIEQQARERFDLVNKGDLVFIFAEN